MTTYELIRVLRRRWMVGLVGVFLTLAVALAVVRRPGVYFTEVDAYFIAPAGVGVPRLSNPSESLIALAGLVERRVNFGRETSTMASASVTIVDVGIRDGWAVILPDFGGQWATNFAVPVLLIQAAGATAERAAELQQTAANDVLSVLDDLQASEGIPEQSRVTVRLVARQPGTYLREGRPKLAIAFVLALGGSLTLAACAAVDRRFLRRRLSLVV